MTNPTPTAEQQAIRGAMTAANPDIEGDLMRKLIERGVDGPVRAHMALLSNLRQGRRSRFVQGWRP